VRGDVVADASSGWDDVYTDDHGRLRCRAHGKAAYQGEAEAGRAAVVMARKGSADPGLEAYLCEATGMWHLGHAGRWRSFGRLVEEGTRHVH
jgi:hypothetical protein